MRIQRITYLPSIGVVAFVNEVAANVSIGTYVSQGMARWCVGEVMPYEDRASFMRAGGLRSEVGLLLQGRDPIDLGELVVDPSKSEIEQSYDSSIMCATCKKTESVSARSETGFREAYSVEALPRGWIIFNNFPDEGFAFWCSAKCMEEWYR